MQIEDKEVADFISSPRMPDNDFTMWRLDVNEIVSQFEHDLKGEYYDVNKRMWVSKGAQLLNDDGVKMLTSLLGTIVNKVTFLTSLNEREIKQIMLEFNIALVELLFYQWKEFDVKKEHLGLIVTKVVRFIFVALKRADMAGERESLKSESKVIRVHTEGGGKGMGLPSIFKRGGGE
jgi:hypothetical protein